MNVAVDVAAAQSKVDATGETVNCARGACCFLIRVRATDHVCLFARAVAGECVPCSLEWAR